MENATSAPATSDSASDSDNHATITHHFEFRGRTGEYFKIWAVNILLSIVTLGIYSAWAKVRTRRYFYGNTFLDGENFEYHAKPLSILIARIIVVVVVIGGAWWAGEDILNNALHSSLLFLLLPWALVRGFSFNARNSSYRGVRFAFHRAYGQIYKIYLIPIILVLGLNAFNVVFESPINDDTNDATEFAAVFFGAFSLFLFAMLIIAPFIIRAFHAFKAGNHSWGSLSLTFEKPPFSSYIKALWGVSFLFFIIISIYAAVIVGKLFLEEVPSIYPVVIVFFTVVFYIALLFLWNLVRAMLFRLFWNGIRAEGGYATQCHFSASRFAVKILLVNFIAIALSLGLLYPWAKIRKTRYLAQHINIVAAATALDNVVAAYKEKESALGEEFDAAEGFDFDVGLI